MRVGIIINTPAQAHFYKNIIRRLQADGHTVSVLARDYGETTGLLRSEGIDFFTFSSRVGSRREKLASFPRDLLKVRRRLRAEKTDLIVGGGIFPALACRRGRPHVDFGDGEPRRLGIMQSALTWLTMRFEDVMVTPAAFGQDLGRKQVRVESFKELAYLGPAYYRPSGDIYGCLGIPPSRDYILLRFCAFDALHDVGVRGFSAGDRVKLVRELEKYATVFVSSESEVPPEIRDRILDAPKDRIHDVIAHARLVVSDTGTINSEAAVLGVPSVRYSTIGGERDIGVFRELERKYGLIYTFDDPAKAIARAVDLARTPGLAGEWRRRRARLLADSIDIAEFFVWFVEQYPESFETMKRTPAVQRAFANPVAVPGSGYAG